MGKHIKTWQPVIRERKLPSGAVAYQVDLGVLQGKRVMRQFPTLPEAEIFARNKSEEAEKGQLAPVQLTKGETLLALQAFQQLDQAKIQRERLGEFVAYALAHLTQVKPVTVKLAYDGFLARCTETNLRPNTIRNYKRVLIHLAACRT